MDLKKKALALFMNKGEHIQIRKMLKEVDNGTKRKCVKC